MIPTENKNIPELYKPKNYPKSLPIIDNMDEDYKQHCAKLQIFYDSIYEKFPYSKINTISNNSLQNLDISFTYGEILFKPFADIFYVIKKQFGLLQNKGGKFYDLGCGTAKPATAAMLLHEFDEIIGIEYIDEIYEIVNKEVKQEYENTKPQIKEYLSNYFKNENFVVPELNIIQGDMFEIDWSDAECIFVNSTCLDEEMMNKIYQQSLKMKKNSVLICTTYSLPVQDNTWEQLTVYMTQFQWGEVSVFIYKKNE